MKIPSCINIALCGAGGAGKTSLVNRYMTNTFDPEQTKTQGMTYATTSLSVTYWHVELQVWDFGDQVEYRPLWQEYLGRMDGVILMFDLTSYSSFLALDHWMELMHEPTAKVFPILLVGCKDDQWEIAPWQAALSESSIWDYVRTNCLLGYIQTSAASGKNVAACIDQLVRKIIAQNLVQEGHAH